MSDGTLLIDVLPGAPMNITGEKECNLKVAHMTLACTHGRNITRVHITTTQHSPSLHLYFLSFLLFCLHPFAIFLDCNVWKVIKVHHEKRRATNKQNRSSLSYGKVSLLCTLTITASFSHPVGYPKF